MIVLTKRLLGIGMTSGLLMLLTMLFLRGGIASAASLSGGANQGVAKYTLQLCVSETNGQLICPSGINVHAQSGTTKPVVSNGHPVTITLSGTTYVVADPSAIHNHWLDVTVPANLA